jgi:DNA-binding transcriptional LysR family regulator
VNLVIEATDREVNLIEERCDLALRARPQVGDTAGIVAKKLGTARPILVASPAYLGRCGRPARPEALPRFDTLGRTADLVDGRVRWELVNATSGPVLVHHSPRLISNDLGLQLEAAIHGIGITLLPEPVAAASLRAGLLEQVLPAWAAPSHIMHLLYPSPRGMLPSVRSVIDYLMVHLPPSIQERGIVVAAAEM